MKKLFALILAVLMIASLSVIGFAAEVDGGTTGDVKVNITDEQGNDFNPAKIYNVVLEWEPLTFNVSAKTAVWNTKTLMYDLDVATVSNAKKTIKVTNNSNAPVEISASFPNGAKSATMYGVTAALAGADRTLVSAVNRTAADNMTYEVSVSGNPTAVPDMTYTINTITVTVRKP